MRAGGDASDSVELLRDVIDWKPSFFADDDDPHALVEGLDELARAMACASSGWPCGRGGVRRGCPRTSCS